MMKNSLENYSPTKNYMSPINKWYQLDTIITEILEDLGIIFPNYYRFQKNIVKAIRKLKFIKKSIDKYGFGE